MLRFEGDTLAGMDVLDNLDQRLVITEYAEHGLEPALAHLAHRVLAEHALSAEL